MTPEEMNLGYRSHKEWLEKGNPDVVDELYAQDCIIYNRHVPEDWKHGTEGFKKYGAMLFAGFPDLKIHHDVVVTEGNKQAIGWTFEGTHLGPIFGIPATGKRVHMSGWDIFGIENGKINELWLEQDMISLLGQLGVIPGQG